MFKSELDRPLMLFGQCSPRIYTLLSPTALGEFGGGRTGPSEAESQDELKP